MHTELSRLIAGCCDHTTSAAAPYRKGFTAELRVIALFDGCIERIHVGVHDDSCRGWHGILNIQSAAGHRVCPLRFCQLW